MDGWSHLDEWRALQFDRFSSCAIHGTEWRSPSERTRRDICASSRGVAGRVADNGGACRIGVASAGEPADRDGFKRINNEHGHPAGDELLRDVASTLQALARGLDDASRVLKVTAWRVQQPDPVIELVDHAERTRDALTAIGGIEAKS